MTYFSQTKWLPKVNFFSWWTFVSMSAYTSFRVSLKISFNLDYTLILVLCGLRFPIPISASVTIPFQFLLLTTLQVFGILQYLQSSSLCGKESYWGSLQCWKPHQYIRWKPSDIWNNNTMSYYAQSLTLEAEKQ